MEITYDASKRTVTLADRGVDFESAIEIFAGKTWNVPDERRDYGEVRILTVGHLHGRMMIVIWTPRGSARHIISMRKANAREKANYGKRLEED
jgi:uncharacterized DUF497 family protein